MTLDTLAKGEVPVPGPQNGRYASEPIKGLTSLKGERAHDANASITLALAKGDTVARIMGEAPVIRPHPAPMMTAKVQPAAAEEGAQPEQLPEARGGQADDLKQIKGVGPKLESTLNELGIFHYDQVAGWSAAEAAWVDDRLSFKGRVARPRWLEQASARAGKG